MRDVITTVVAPASSSALTTLTNVKAVLGLKTSDSDTLINFMINQASGAITSYCNRSFGQATYKDSVRLLRTGGLAASNPTAGALKLSAWPIVSITSITEMAGGTSTVLDPAADFEADQVRGLVYRLDGNGMRQPWTTDQIITVFVAGFALPNDESPTLPPDIEDAAIRLVKARYLEANRDPFVKSEMVAGIGTTEYWISTGTDGNFTPDVADILDNYRVPLIG